VGRSTSHTPSAPGSPAAQTSFDDIVLFDIPRPREADRLCERLQPDRLAWLHEHRGNWVVAASLTSEAGDLAALLRAVERWVEERGLDDVRFELDGRTYPLRRGPAEARLR
jgi:hypothetical protein